MAFYETPLNTQEDTYQLRTTYDGAIISLRLRYNNRNDCWYCTLLDSNNNILIESIPLLSRVIRMFDIYHVLPNTMLGDLIMQDITTGLNDCDRENLGSVIKMFYVNNL